MMLTPMRRSSDLFRSLFGRDLRSFFEPIYDEEGGPLREGFLPPIDVFHDEEKVTIRVEAPGVEKKDLDVHVEGDLLTISGKKEHVESPSYHQIESRCGAFHRSITLPHTVDREKIAAAYKHGVLTLTLPLTAEAKPKQIDVQID
jgi:HSP20 family protein